MSTIILPSAPATTEDAKRYANGMAEIRQRVGIARMAVARIRETRNQDLVSTETIFLQMRKICELIAFGSLIANKELYSQHYETFAEDWRLGRVVDKLRKVNPNFFPVPMSAPYEVASAPAHVAGERHMARNRLARQRRPAATDGQGCHVLSRSTIRGAL